MAEVDTPGPNEIYCPECGDPTPKDWPGCRYCGAELDFAGSQKNEGVSRSTEVTATAFNRWKRRGTMALVLSFLILPVVFAPVGGYYALKVRSVDRAKGNRMLIGAVGSLLFWYWIFHTLLG